MKSFYLLTLIASLFLLKLDTTAQTCGIVYGAGWAGSGSSVGVQAYNYATNTWTGSSLESLSYFTAPYTVNNGGPIAVDPLNQNINFVTDASPSATAIFTFGSAPTFVTFPASLSSVTAQLLCSGYKPSSHICYYMSQNFLSTYPSPSNTGFFSIDFTNLAAPVAKSYTSVLAPGSPFVNTTNGGDICFDANGTGYLVTAAKQLYTVVTDETALTATFTYIADLSALPFQPTAIAFDPFASNSLTITSGFAPHYSNYNLATNAITILTNNGGWIAGDLASCVFPNLNPALKVTKSLYDVTQASAPPVIIGTNDIVQYTVTVKNTGNVNAGNFTITDTVPAGVAYIPGSTTMNGIPVADGPGGTFPFATSATANSSDQAAGSGILSTYASVGSPTCVIKYNVKVTAASGSTVVNLAIASATGSSPTVFLIDSAKASFNVDLLTPLAVTLLNFTAAQADNLVKLNWTTSGDANNSSFEIERSTDGTSFSTIGTVMAVPANGGSDQNYSFADAKPAAGNNYYRLKEMNIAGTYSFSSVKLVQFTKSETSAFKVYPNPVRASAVTLLAGTSYQQLNVRIMNIVGQLQTQKTYTNVNGNISVDISSLQKGIYFVAVNADGATLLPTKLIVE